jgi:hypothetical protein
MGGRETKPCDQAWLVKRPQFDSIVAGTRPISRHELPADCSWLGRNRRGEREHAGPTVFWSHALRPRPVVSSRIFRSEIPYQCAGTGFPPYLPVPRDGSTSKRT